MFTTLSDAPFQPRQGNSLATSCGNEFHMLTPHCAKKAFRSSALNRLPLNVAAHTSAGTGEVSPVPRPPALIKSGQAGMPRPVASVLS